MLGGDERVYRNSLPAGSTRKSEQPKMKRSKRLYEIRENAKSKRKLNWI
jgi:hypothetical protein